MLFRTQTYIKQKKSLFKIDVYFQILTSTNNQKLNVFITKNQKTYLKHYKNEGRFQLMVLSGLKN